MTKNVWTRLGMSPTDKSTWTRLRTNMPGHNTFDASQFAPHAWQAIVELCGSGDESLITPSSKQWKDSLIVNLGSPETENNPTPPQSLDGWHIDGDFFVHYLDSPEQALLVIPLFTDIEPEGGGTFICPEAIPKIARHLYNHPEGVSPRMTPRGQPGFTQEKDLSWCCDVAKSCANFVEVTGKTGDVYLLHPLMLHSASSNSKRNLRIITNPPVALREPFIFDRPDGEKYSLVEQVTLRALGKNPEAGEGLGGWKITHPREGVVPERVRIQERMKREEVERLRKVAEEEEAKKRNKNQGTTQEVSAAA